MFIYQIYRNNNCAHQSVDNHSFVHSFTFKYFNSNLKFNDRPETT